MKILLFPNGPEGWQSGVEDGFNHLLSTGRIESVRLFYLGDQVAKHGASEALAHALQIAREDPPDLIVLFHVGNLPIEDSFMTELRQLSSKPTIAYDEGDMYGSWSKPVTAAMKAVIRAADVVSVRGLGRFRRELSRYNRKIIYTPHHADIARFDSEPYVLRDRDIPVVLIGNRIKPGLRGRMPGAAGRESFVKFMGREFPDEFVLHGNGWNGFVGNRGPVDFQKQMEFYRRSWVTVAYEHYPEIPYYFSNRLPIALLAGSLYVCHRHGGYDEIFTGLDFIFSFDTAQEAADIIRYLRSLSADETYQRGQRARNFALKHYTPQVVWANFVNNILIATGRDEI
jgi:hypothetical protein